MRTSRLLLFAFIFLAATAHGEPSPALGGLLQDVDALRREQQVPSVALTLVSKQQTLWTGAMGLADRATRRPATAETLYRIGSITKAFTSLAILLASEQGRLSLDDRLKALAPDAPLNNPWAAGHPVRISHLLEHSAGLLDISKAEFDHSDPTPLTLRQALAVEPEARICLWPPGLHSSYSNAGAGLAAYALEQVVDQRYEDFIEQQLFGPLGMHRAGFFLDEATRAGLATGYDSDGRTVIPYWHTLFRPFGGINATAREMAGLVRLLLNRGRLDGKTLLSAASIERMEVPLTTLAAQSGLSYGYGLGNYQSVHRGFLFHGHGGDGDGYLSHYAYSHELGLGYFVVINAFNKTALNNIRRRIQDYLVEGQTARSPEPVSVTEAQLKRLVGRYREVTYRFNWNNPGRHKGEHLDVVVEDGKLFTRTETRRRRELLPVNTWHFRREHQPLGTIAFIEHQGEMYLQADFGNYRRLEDSTHGE